MNYPHSKITNVVVIKCVDIEDGIEGADLSPLFERAARRTGFSEVAFISQFEAAFKYNAIFRLCRLALNAARFLCKFSCIIADSCREKRGA